MVSQRDMFNLSGDEIAEKEIVKMVDVFDVEGLEDMAEGLRGLGSGVHKTFYEAYLLGRNLFEDAAELSVDEKRDDDLLTLAYQNLSSKHFFSLKKDLITFTHFSEIFEFIFPIYYVYLGRKLGHNDVKRIYDTKIYERLIFFLDNFDTNSPEVMTPTAEYFQKLKKVQWADKETQKLFKLTDEIRLYGTGGRHASNLKLIDFQVRESMFLLSLAGCNAINNKRDKITLEDIVKTHKTYFKLLKTNLPALVDNLSDIQ